MWAYPTLVNNSYSSNAILTDEQVESWKEKGFALVNGLLSNDLCNEVYKEATDKLSTLERCDFGSGGLLEFPCGLDACDRVTLHPNILRAAAQLLDIKVRDLRLTQSDVWLKKGKENSSGDPLDNNSQRVHCGNKCLSYTIRSFATRIFFF